MTDLMGWKRAVLRGAATSSSRTGRRAMQVRLRETAILSLRPWSYLANVVPHRSRCSRGFVLALPGALFFLTAAAPLSAQVGATLRGVVRSGMTGEALSGATVEIVGTAAVTRTGDDGRYGILTVPMGVSVVRITHPDHVGVVERLDVDEATVVLRDFEMMPPSYVLEEVVARVLGRVDIPDREIEGHELQGNRGVREVLDGVSGVTLVRTGGAVGMGYYLRIRGVKSFTFNRHPVVFIDGVQVRAEGVGGGLGALELINPGTIARIEVLKGPAAGAEYGPDAADGVVLITTRRGKGG